MTSMPKSKTSIADLLQSNSSSSSSNNNNNNSNNNNSTKKNGNHKRKLTLREKRIELRRQVAPLAARAAWSLTEWTDMKDYVQYVPYDTYDGAFFRAVLSIHDGALRQGHVHLERTASLLADGTFHVSRWSKIENWKCSQLCTILLVIIVKMIFLRAFFFYCLLCNHSFRTNPKSVTNLSKLFYLSLLNCSLRRFF